MISRSLGPDRLVALGIAALGAAWAAQASVLKFGSLNSPGPGFFPTVLALLMAGLGLWIALRPPAAEARAGTVPGGALRAALITGITLLAALSMERLGYLAVLFAAMLAYLRIAKVGWAAAVPIGAAATVLSYLLFAVGLGVPLPMGVFQ